MHQHLNHNISSDLLITLKFTKISHSFNTRSNVLGLLQLPSVRTQNYGSNSFSKLAIQQWFPTESFQLWYLWNILPKTQIYYMHVLLKFLYHLRDKMTMASQGNSKFYFKHYLIVFYFLLKEKKRKEKNKKRRRK